MQNTKSPIYSRGKVGLKYLSHYLSSSNGRGHGTHSPFVYRFIRDVLRDHTGYPAYKIVERHRQVLMEDRSLLQIEDLGAGSAMTQKKTRTVSDLAKKSAKPKKLGRLLFRMARQFQPGTIVELGTSLGISTSYFALASPGARILTLEGSDAIADKASENFEKLHLTGIRIIRGNFEDTLPGVLAGIPSLDLYFVDGNHRKLPTLDYFRQALPKMNNDSVMIFDDIHWSEEMEEAWELIRNDASVRCSIDIFWMGIVFFRKEFHEKQHFHIRF